MTELRIGDKVILNIAKYGEPLYGEITAKFESAINYPKEKSDKRLPQTELLFISVYKATFTVPGRDYPTTRVFDQNAIWDGYILIDGDKHGVCCYTCKHNNKKHYQTTPEYIWCDMFSRKVVKKHHCDMWVKE
jgi:hypothetical protein